MTLLCQRVEEAPPEAAATYRGRFAQDRQTADGGRVNRFIILTKLKAFAL